MSNRKVWLPEASKWAEVTDEAEETFARIDKDLEKNSKEVDDNKPEFIKSFIEAKKKYELKRKLNNGTD